MILASRCAHEERIPVGSWIVIDVEVRPPYPSLFNDLHFRCDVDSWGNAYETLSFYYGILEMNSTEFELLEESGRFELLSNQMNVTFEYFSGRGQGQFLDESYGSYVCVLKIISDINPSENSYVEGSLRISQEAY